MILKAPLFTVWVLPLKKTAPDLSNNKKMNIDLNLCSCTILITDYNWYWPLQVPYTAHMLRTAGARIQWMDLTLETLVGTDLCCEYDHAFYNGKMGIDNFVNFRNGRTGSTGRFTDTAGTLGALRPAAGAFQRLERWKLECMRFRSAYYQWAVMEV